MAQPHTNEDGNLPETLQALEDAVAALIDPFNIIIDNQILTTPSLYMQLRDAVTGEQCNTGTGGGTISRPPLWVDAFKLLDEIDTGIQIWQPQTSCTPPTIGRIRILLERPWRPQDCNAITKMTKVLKEWAKDITNLLFPDRKFSLPNPCPACGERAVYRPDSSGEPVRQAALQIDNDGCKCLACKYVWGIERFQILAAAIQQDTNESKVGMTAAELIAKLSRVAPDTLVVTTDSTSFRYITEFTARTVEARIREHHSIGKLIQVHNPKIPMASSDSTAHIIVLSQQTIGNEL